MTSDDRLDAFVRQFQESCDGTQTARAASENCRDYYDGKQWTSAETKKLKKRGQPVITDNRIQDKVQAWLGLELATRTDPHAYPRTPKEESGAEAATDALRYIADDNHFPQVKSQVFDNILVEGTGGAEIVVETIKGKPCVKIRRIRWDRMYWDAHSMLADYSDAQFKGIVVWMDIDAAKKKYPSQAADYDAMLEGSFDFGDTYDDKPTMWIDRTRKRVQILEHYFNEDGWKRVVFSRAGIIEPEAPSPYLDEYGDPCCPLEFQSAYVDRDGNRYGVVPRYLPLQDEINHRRSKALHLLTSRSVIAEKGAVADLTTARNELARPDGIVQVTPGLRFDVNDTRDLAMGQFNLLADALRAFDVTGPNSAVQGNEGKQSGRAQQIAQQANVVQLGPVLDGLRYWQNRVMRQAWGRVKQFWKEETWIRVTDNEKTRFVALNRRITRGEYAIEQAKEGGATPEQLAQLVQQMAQDPTGPQEILINGAAEMDVDIVIDEAPDTITLQSEQWLQLTELAKNGIPIKPETLIKASTLRNKDELIEDIETQQQGAGIPPQVADEIKKIGEELQKRGEALESQEQQLQQQQNQIATASSALKVQAAEFDASVKIAKAELEATRKIFSTEQRVAQATLKADRAQRPAKPS